MFPADGYGDYTTYSAELNHTYNTAYNISRQGKSTKFPQIVTESEENTTIQKHASA